MPPAHCPPVACLPQLSQVMAEARRLLWYHRERYDRLVGLLCVAGVLFASLLVGWQLLSFAGVVQPPATSEAAQMMAAAECAAACGALLIVGHEIWEAHLHRLAAAAERRLAHTAQRGA